MYKLSPDSFWELFTKPSMNAMLHYSANTFTNDVVEIQTLFPKNQSKTRKSKVIKE